VSVTTVAGLAATGKVTLMSGKKTLGSGKLSNGKVTIKFTSKKKGKLSVVAKYAGDGNYLAGKSGTVKVKVK